MSIDLTGFKVKFLKCFAIAEINPAERVRVPLKGIDISEIKHAIACIITNSYNSRGNSFERSAANIIKIYLSLDYKTIIK